MTVERSKEGFRTRSKETGSPFWAAFLISPEVILVHDTHGRIVEANPAAQEKIGYSVEELESMNILQLVVGSKEEMRERMDQLEVQGELSYRARYRRKDGTTFEAEVRSRKVELDGKCLIVGVGRDITDLRLAEMLNSSLDRLSSAISARFDLDEIMRSTVSSARQALGSDSAIIALKEDDTWVVRYEDGPIRQIRKGIFVDDESSPVRILERSGRALVVNDISNDPRMNQQFATRFGIRSLLMAPLKMEGGTTGLLGFFCHDREGAFSDAHVDYTKKLAYSISLLLENARLSALERATEDFLKGVVETVPDAIVTFDPEGRFTFANQAAEKLLGLPRAKILARRHDDPAWSLRDLEGRAIPPEMTPFGRVLRSKEPLHGMEIMIRNEKGQDAIIQINITPMSGLKGQVNGAIASLTDITERKRSEDTLKRRTHQLEVLTDVSNKVNSQLETETILCSLVWAAMELTEATAGASGTFIDGRMVFREYNDGGDRFPIDLSFPKGYGVPGWVISTRKAYMTNQAAQDVHVVPYIREMLGFHNLIVVPIKNARGELLGCLEIHNKAEGQDFTEDDLMIMEGLASSAAVALENARTIEDNARYQTALQKQKRDYQTVFESVPAMIAIKDTQGRVTMANHAFLRTFGLTRDTMGRWTISPDPEAVGRHRLDDQEVIRDKRPKLGIKEMARNGEHQCIWLRTDKMPYLDSKGNVLGVIMFSLDITEQKRAQEQLVREKEHVSTLMETTPSGIVLIDRRGRIVFANRAAEAMLGLERDMIIGRDYDGAEWSITDFEGRPFPKEMLPFAQVVATGNPVFGERHSIEWPDGRKVMLLLNAAPILDDKGSMNGVIVSMEDVTASVLTERALRISLKTSDDIIQQIPSGILLFQYRAPDRLTLLSINPTANALLGGMENMLGLDFDEIWKRGAFFATKEEFLDVVRTGMTIWREGVHYSDLSVNGNFTFRAFCLPDERLCVNFDDVTERIHEAELRRQAFAQIERNIEHFATLVDGIRNPLAAIMAHAENNDGEASGRIIRRALEIESILGQLDQRWLESEKVRGFLKRTL